MTPEGLHVAAKLVLPIDVVGESTAILAKKGAGKSNTAKVIVEETLDHGGVQVIVLDPIGHWWSLRAGANGKPKGGYPVAVFGGMHGDLPLEPTAGRLLAQTAVESGQSIILDVSSLDSDGAMQRFAFEFGEELYKLKQATPTPTLLVLEEADEFAPQDTRGSNMPRMVGAFNRIVKRGRGRGIGTLVVTQRSAALSKNVLDQSDTLIVMRTIGPRDRDAIEGWVKHAQAAGSDQVLPSLPSLETGEAWVWTPERALLERVKIRKARTFDSSQTPRPGEAALVADVKPIDVDALGEKIRATVERAKENDPAELRKRLRQLESERDAWRQSVRGLEREIERGAAREVEKIVQVEVPILTDADRDLIGSVRRTLQGAADNIAEALGTISAQFDRIEARHKLPQPLPHAEPQPQRQQSKGGSQTERAERGTARTPSRAVPAAPSGADGDLPLGAAKLLAVLAQFPEGRTRKQLGVLSGYKASGSTFRGAIAELRKRGYATAASVDPIRATPEGLAAAPTQDLPPTGGRELYEYWHGRLPLGAQRLLELLYHAAAAGMSRDELAEAAGYEATGSTFRGAIAALRNVDLATRAGVEPIRIADALMEDA